MHTTKNKKHTKLHPLKNREELKNLKTSWTCVALSLIQQRPPPSLALPPQPQCSPQTCWKEMKQSEKCIVSQTGYEPKWFFPSVGDQMVSEITVAKGPKLALPPV